MADALDYDALHAALDEYRANATMEVDLRWQAWPKDFAQNEVHEVIGALLARQKTLATSLVGTPAMWTGHTAPIILRAMADVHITLAWTLLDPLDRSRKFIHYGLGQMKLQIEHYKSHLESDPLHEPGRKMVEAFQAWLDSQRFGFLTEVNVGSWSEIPVRKMAHEAGLKEFYDFVYAPFSAATHSTWHHISRYNLEHCQNPLHRYHRVPAENETGNDPNNALLAAKYLNKSFVGFDDKFDISVDPVNSCDRLEEQFASVFGY